MSLKGQLILGALRALPEKHMSRGMHRLVQVRSKAAVRWFAARFDANLDEAEKPIDEYESVLDFFTRRLKPGVRPLDPDPNALLCPVDGALDAFGKIEDGTLLQAKGRSYSLSAFLADEAAAATFEGGSFMTLYLSPKDYHRTHSPAGGGVRSAVHVPGRLMPVFPDSVASVDELFARNERLVMHLETEVFGRIAYVMVGATNVGRIRVSFDDQIATNDGTREIRRHDYDPPRPVERGGELGVFEMGSTVILILPACVELDEGLEKGMPIRLGMRLGRLSKP